MRIILLGAPGAGKGTQAVILSERFNIPHISTGDIFRSNIKNNTELGKNVKEYIDKGLLVPDELTIDIVKDRINESDCSDGFILDGFPRTIQQAQELDNILRSMDIELDCVLNINVSDEKIIRRLSGRRVCECGKTYHVQNNPPKQEGVCDSCTRKLFQRNDDREETVIQRLETYHQQTEPLIGYYKNSGKFITVEGQDSIDDTTKEVLNALNGV
jgi:adenylate kinase